MVKGKILPISINMPLSRIILLVFIIITMPIIIYFQIKGSPFTRKGEEITIRLSNINAEQIVNIEVCESYSCSNYLLGDEVNTHESKQLFARAINKLNIYHSNHDYPEQKFYIRMHSESGELFEFDVYLKGLSYKTAYLNIVEQYELNGDMHLANLGGRKSKGLYSWLDYHNLIKAGAE